MEHLRVRHESELAKNSATLRAFYQFSEITKSRSSDLLQELQETGQTDV